MSEERDKMEDTGMINGTPVHQDGKKLWQYLAATSACFLAVGVGTALGWTSPVLPRLSKPGSWLLIDEDQASWIGSMCALGAIAGALASGPMANKLGRKKSILLLAAPFLSSWALIILASQLWLIYASRFLVGIGVGASCVLVPTYISEIAETSARGTLGALFQVFLTVGIVFAFSFGAVLDYTAFAIVCALIEVVFVASFLKMPESPSWLMTQNRRPDASIALTVLRGDAYNQTDELSEMQKANDESSSKKSSIFDLIRTPGARRAAMASFGAMMFQQLSGVNAVIFYTAAIFQAAGSSLDSNVASIIVASVQMVMAIVAAVIVDRVGRKPLLMFSSGVVALTLVALGYYFHLKSSGSDVQSLGWLPLLSLTFFMIAFSIGLGPIPWMLMGELFTLETKAVASGVAVTINWFLVFVVTKTFPQMQASIGPAATFWLFAGIMAGATVFTFFFVPETKGKSLQEIQNELNGGPRLARPV